MATQKAHEQVECLAEMLVLADAKDMPSLAALHTGFEGIAVSANTLGQPRVAEVARLSASWLEKLILEEVDDPANVLDDLNQVVASFQAIIRDGRAAEEVRWPAKFGPNEADSKTSAADDAPLVQEKGGNATSVQVPDMPTDMPEQTPPVSERDTEPPIPTAPPPSSSAPLEGDPSLLSEFVTEAREHLEAADINLLNLESAGTAEDPDALNAVFRAFHTIKGVAGFLALDEILGLAHEAENLLDRARKQEVELSGPAMDVTFDAVDMLKRLVGNVSNALESGGPLTSTPAVPALVERIKAIAAGKTAPAPQKDAPSAAKQAKPLGEIMVESGAVTQESLQGALKQQEEQGHEKLGEILVHKGKALPTHVRMALDVQKDDPAQEKIGDILVEMGVIAEEDVDATLQQQHAGATTRKLGELLVETGQAAAKDVAQALRAQNAQPAAGTQVRETVKVDADRLDLLVDMIGELVIAESMVSQSVEMRSGRSPELVRSLTQLDKITRELQEMGTSLRMVPIRATFQKMARLVRDLAKKSGKEVEFITTGEDTELDKSVVDKIGDPLIHMVRNAVDHGLEAGVEERRQAGKSAAGHVELRAFHKGGNIYIEIVDDGRGLDREAILAKARARGLVREGDTPSDHEVWNLIFEPGLSTAKTITDVSGRGVGMDVVRRNIEALRGQVEIQSEPGKGTTFSIRLPLTLAIIDGMVVRVGHERYIIPTLSIVMSIRPEPRQVSTVVGRGEMLSLQGHLLPLFRLTRLFNIQEGVQEISEGIVMVVEDEGRRTGLLVDEILGQQQIVIKSLGEALQGLMGIAGGAIMPDGIVGLILDVGGVVKAANEDKRGTTYAETTV